MNALILRILAAFATIVAACPRSADAAAPAGRYVVTAGSGPGNGTVYDTRTKLTWQQTMSSKTYTFDQAPLYCLAIGSSLGGTGWRVPTVKELLSLVDYSQSTKPFIDRTAFPGVPAGPSLEAGYFWSSSIVPGAMTYWWYVDFDSAVSAFDANYKAFNVRCVR
jgi:hypothetical protein